MPCGSCPLSASSIYCDPWYPPVQSMCLTVFSANFVQVFFGLPLGLAPSTSYSTHFFTQSLSSFHYTCPYLRNLFCCSTEIMSSNPSLSLNPFTWNSIFQLHAIHLSNHSHLCPLNCHLIFLTYGPSLTTMQHTIQPLYNLPLTFSDISLLIRNCTNCLNLLHPIQIQFSTAASASPSTLNMSPKQ